ncbi:unnamed protein product, partial [Oikopleura dioica]
ARCPYEILGVSDFATNKDIQSTFDNIKQAFDTKKEAYELLSDADKQRAYDHQKANDKKLKRKIEQLEKELECEKKSCIEDEKKGRIKDDKELAVIRIGHKDRNAFWRLCKREPTRSTKRDGGDATTDKI